MNEMPLRPDEISANSQIQKAKERDSFLDNGIVSKIMPFLSAYIPAALAVKGISKLSPKLGEFLKNGEMAGLDVKKGLEFIKDKLEKKPSGTPPTSASQTNIIQQYSPELHQFIDQEVRKGRAPLEAGALARAQGFDKIISKIEKDNNANWSSIIETVFGGAKNANPQNQSPKNEAQPQSKAALQGSDANAQLMQMMQKFMDVLKG